MIDLLGRLACLIAGFALLGMWAAMLFSDYSPSQDFINRGAILALALANIVMARGPSRD